MLGAGAGGEPHRADRGELCGGACDVRRVRHTPREAEAECGAEPEDRQRVVLEYPPAAPCERADGGHLRLVDREGRVTEAFRPHLTHPAGGRRRGRGSR